MVHPVGVLVRRGEAEFGILEETTDGVLANIFGGNDLGVLGPEIKSRHFHPRNCFFIGLREFFLVAAVVVGGEQFASARLPS